MSYSKDTKADLVASFGGGCSRCGYKRSMRALQFHHTDSSEKNDWNSGKGNASLKEVITHPDRFLLLCANCHFEEHERIDAERRMQTCPQCQTVFENRESRRDMGRGIYCSPACTYASRRKTAEEGVLERAHKHILVIGECWQWTGYSIRGVPIMSNLREDGTFAPQSLRQTMFEMHFKTKAPKRIRLSCQTNLCVRPEHLLPQPNDKL